MKLTTAIQAFKKIKLNELSIRSWYCPICLMHRYFIRLRHDEINIRCLSCRSSAVTLSIASVLEELNLNLKNIDIYELSSRGPLFKFLKKNNCKLTYSEYYMDTPLGEFKNGIQCQDVQHLTYKDKSFDLCTSTDVFEHVPNDLLGFRDILRVLKKNGVFVFTVPLHAATETVERAKILPNGDVKHILSPEYHGDPITESDSILAFRNYGQDIVQRLKSLGFSQAEIVQPRIFQAWGASRSVVIAHK
jgi:SAM-dependent methyltransferase